MIALIVSVLSVCTLVLFAGVIALRVYQFQGLLHVGWTGVYFAMIIIMFLALRRGGRAFILGAWKRAARRAEWFGIFEKRLKKTNIGASMDPGRRRFISSSINVGIVAVTGSILADGLVSGSLTPRVLKTNIPVKNFPADLDGFRIVQVSDTHVKDLVTRAWVRDVVEKINSLEPDIVVHTGDFADAPVGSARDVVAPFADISSRFGCYFVTGNHEYYPWSGRVEDWLEELDRLGFAVLMNEHVIIQRGSGRILLGGMADPTAGEFRPAHLSDPFEVMAGARPSDYKILLAHKPGCVNEAAEAGFDLQLSGHTHGGQFFPLQYVAALILPYVSGLYNHDNMHIYVNQGAGYVGPPIRSGAPAEISLLTLVRSA